MKKEGLNDNQIAQRLREEGASPRQIDEAMDQSSVKAMVGTYEESPSNEIEPQDFHPQRTREIDSQPVDYSQFANPISKNSSSDYYEEPSSFETQQLPEDTKQVYSQEENYPQGANQYHDQYPQYQYPVQESQLDTEVITDLIEQIIEEKTNEIQKNISDFTKFKIEMNSKMQDLNDRLKRIESIIDRLQASIIGQIGNYGKNISDLKKEMILTQESFSKILNPFSDQMNELKKIAAGQKSAEKPSK